MGFILNQSGREMAWTVGCFGGFPLMASTAAGFAGTLAAPLVSFGLVEAVHRQRGWVFRGWHVMVASVLWYWFVDLGAVVPSLWAWVAVRPYARRDTELS